MDCLVHEGSTSVQLPGSAPGPAVIIFLRSEPFDIRVSNGETPKATSVDGTLEALGGFVKPRWENRAKCYASLLARCNDLVAAVERDLQGFLHDHMLAGLCRSHGRFQVGAARSADCLLYTSPSPRDKRQSRMPSSA